MDISEDTHLAHYGILRRSGRYPWGSGATQDQRNRKYLDAVSELRKKGYSETEIVKSLGLNSVSELRAASSIARNEVRAANIAQVQAMSDKGMSTNAIGARLDIPEATVRTYLKPGAADRADALKTTSQLLMDNVDKHGFVDVGAGVEQHLNITKDRLKTAIAMAKEKGYEIHTIQVDQLGTAVGKKTLVKVLAKRGTDYKDAKAAAEQGQIHQLFEKSTDNGRTYLGLVSPLSISANRVGIRYKEDGGDLEDGIIHVRRGVEDVSMGGSNYAQVRVMVNNTHYLKGMAVYRDDLPKGVDLVFNTNKSNTGNKLDAMKPIKDDPDNPFGAAIQRQLHKLDSTGREIPGTVRSAMNLVNEEGSWESWKNTLSSQMLSKQKPGLIKQQLDMTYERRTKELDEISKLTNPAVRKKLLKEFSEETDTAAVHLKAAGLPRMGNHVILPLTKIKENEIFAPNFKDGETVVLIRYPHGGTFEIPELRVNNKVKQGRDTIGSLARDAVGINPNTAKRLSGADFDGDTVLVIPNPKNKKNRITSTSPLDGLKDFDPQASYPGYSGMPKLSEGRKQQLMGDISNLITDMTIKGASHDQLARAVRHSMVVIDAEKHNLNYKLSAERNGIRQLKEEFQGVNPETGRLRGASTIISRKGSATIAVPERKTSYTIDPKTGKKTYRETGATYVDSKTGKTVVKKERVNLLRETHDASIFLGKNPTIQEKLYVDHSNKLKALANKARVEEVRTGGVRLNPGAKKVYASEVKSLESKLNLALRNRPRERQAQIVANQVVRAKRDANPNMTGDELKRTKMQALNEARNRTGAGKTLIQITPKEWDAIQAGAVSNSKLSEILDNSDMATVRTLATPKTPKLMTSSKTARAKAMAEMGYTQAQIADQLGVSLTTLKDAL